MSAKVARRNRFVVLPRLSSTAPLTMASLILALARPDAWARKSAASGLALAGTVSLSWIGRGSPPVFSPGLTSSPFSGSIGGLCSLTFCN